MARQLELLGDARDHVATGAAPQPEHDPGHRFPLRIAADGTLPDLGRQLYTGHLVEEHWHTVAIGDHRVLEILTVTDPTVSANHELLAATFDEGPTCDPVVGGHRRRKLLQSETVTPESNRVGDYVVLADITTE